MEVIIVKDRDEGSELAARRLRNRVSSKPASVLGLATGQTPELLYRKLTEWQDSDPVNFKQVITFNLDEYMGLENSHPESYHYYMTTHFWGPLGILEDQRFIPNGLSKDPQQECLNYEAMIQEKGPIDLQLLGIGRDGHIGFNEPMSSLGSRTRIKTLTESTRKDNAAAFSSKSEVPYHVITMGIQTILEASEIVMLAFGDAKAEAIKGCVEGPLTSVCPASALQMHPRCKVIIDEAAAKRLQYQSYYREVYEKKPSWQKAEFV